MNRFAVWWSRVKSEGQDGEEGSLGRNSSQSRWVNKTLESPRRGMERARGSVVLKQVFGPPFTQWDRRTCTRYYLLHGRVALIFTLCIFINLSGEWKAWLCLLGGPKSHDPKGRDQAQQEAVTRDVIRNFTPELSWQGHHEAGQGGAAPEIRP